MSPLKSVSFLRRKMRSKDNTVDSMANEVLVVTQTSHDAREEEEGKMLETEKTIKVKHVDESEKIGPNKEDKSAQNDDQMFGLRDLSKDKLLKLLGIMEGEIQVKYLFMNCENVITTCLCSSLQLLLWYLQTEVPQLQIFIT